MAKVTWYSVKDKLPEGNLKAEGVVVLAMPNSIACVYGYYEKDRRELLGFHDDNNGRIKEYKVSEWAYYPYKTK